LPGNLVEDPELRFTNTGTVVANMRVAVTQRIQQDGEWRDGDTSFFKVNVSRGQAEHLADFLAKGDRVMVTSRPYRTTQPSTFRLRDGRSALIWTAPDGSSLLTLDALSVLTASDGSRPIVWRIFGMIKAHTTGIGWQGKQGTHPSNIKASRTDRPLSCRRTVLAIGPEP
jgi:single-stranded DNA-binding protein